MRLWDIYHGDVPVFLQEAAGTSAVQRLQDVGMNCGSEYTSFPLFRGIGPYSRFDHSVGVGLIVWHFTKSMEQAMAGLLHDIATPVFAHVVDFLHGDHMSQESTEAGTGQWIRGSGELRRVLEKFEIPVEAVEDYHRYPIADNDSPRLSADRLEYTLGNAVNYRIISREQAEVYYKDLTVGQNEDGQPELVFSRREAAEGFAMTALECSKIYVANPDRYAMEALAGLLKQAIDQEILEEADLYKQEKDVITRLKQSQMKAQWERFCGYREIICRDIPGKGEGWKRIFAKKRCIDPFVKELGRVSHICPEFKEKLELFREESQDYWLNAR